MATQYHTHMDRPMMSAMIQNGLMIVEGRKRRTKNDRNLPVPEALAGLMTG